jgi:hypothetical protein
MGWRRSAIVCVLVFIWGVGGCKTFEAMFSSDPPTPQQMEQLDRWKVIANELIDESAILQQEILLATDPADRAELEETLARTQAQLEMANMAIQNAETPGDVGWNLLEVGATAATAFFPPAGLALVFIRSLRRMSKKTVPAIFDSIRAGNGPADPMAAKVALLKNPDARKLYERWKNGAPAPDPSEGPIIG